VRRRRRRRRRRWGTLGHPGLHGRIDGSEYLTMTLCKKNQSSS
jgi:hypothetical protein